MTGHEHTRQTPPHDQEAIRSKAAEWHAASAGDDMDWQAFTAWLMADPRHRIAYDEVALADSILDDHRDFLLAAPLETPSEDHIASARSTTGWLRWTGGAVAASLLAILAVPHALERPSTTYRTQAVARSIALHDGSKIELGPHSSLTVTGDTQEDLELSGGAWFDIRHDPARSLAIEAGGIQISDIGTRFDVQANGQQVRVGVADGEVKIAGPALDQPLRLTAGRSLVLDGSEGTAIIRNVAPGSIGLWRSGRLSYRDTPLSLVAADISRYAGVKVEVAASLRDRQFSGTFVIGNGETALRDLSQLMGLELGGKRGSYSLVDKHR